MRLQAYEYELTFQSGTSNSADLLSCQPLPELFRTKPDDSYIRQLVTDAVPKSTSLDDIHSHTKADPELQQVIEASTTNHWSRKEVLKNYFNCRNELSVVDDVLLKGNQLIIPKQLRTNILALAHKSQQGITKTKALMRKKVWWPGINEHITNMVKQCHPCQLTAPATVGHQPLAIQTILKDPWHTIAIDIQGPYPCGYSLLVAFE